MRFTIYIPAIFFTAFFTSAGFSQTTPAINFQKCFGGNLTDIIQDIKKTNDGGYICAAYSSSNNGDVSGNHGVTDLWLLKLDGSFAIEWQKCLGGTDSDIGISVIPTQDGGYLAGASSYSDDGDVTGHHGTTSSTDFWVVKTDNAGNIEWQKSLGGTSSESLHSVLQAGDGSYYLTGHSSSNDGDVTGNHGQSDVWIVHLGISGNIIWQKCFGGSLADLGWNMVNSANGTFTICGGSKSSDGDLSSNDGDSDGWLFNIDDSGNLLWEKSYGGSKYDFLHSLILSSDGNYVMTGFSMSSNGDITINHGAEDVWVIKTDLSGNSTWSASFGGSQTDLARDVCETINGQYAIFGMSSSVDGDISGNNGLQDCWLGEINSDGLLIWQKSLGSGDNDDGNTITTDHNGNLLAGGYAGANGGDVSGSHGDPDGWLVQMEAECNTYTIADFNYSYSGYTYTFSDQSVNAVTWLWNFGDGTTSTQPAPIHTYANPGIYEVCLITGNNCFSDTTCTEIITCSILSADFGYLQSGLTFSFSDSSTGALSWLWNFDDGNTSNLQSPVHTFSQDGIYEVCLTVADSCDSKTQCATINTCGPIAAGYSYAVNGFTVDFTDASSGNIVNYLWDFDDGNTSNLQNPSHTYPLAGSYKVKLTVESNCESKTVKQTIQVCGPAQASFTVQQNGAWVQFTNTSSYFDTYKWDFGSGPASILTDPLHYFTTAGSYNVCLVAKNKCEADTFCEAIIAPASAVLENCWAATYDDALNTTDQGYKIAADADGNVFVAGSNTDKLFLLKYDPYGNLLWMQSYDSASFTFVIKDMAVDANNNACITAYQYNAFPGDWLTLKFDGAGNLLWHRVEGLGNGQTDIPYTMAVDDDNNVYVGGTKSQFDYDRFFHTIKYDSNGVILWQAYYDYAQFEDQVSDLAVDSSGNVYVTGEFTDPTGSASDFATIKYNANGIFEWLEQAGSNAFCYARFVSVNHDGNIIMAGFDSDFGEYNRTYTRCYDSSSNTLWVHEETPDSADDMYHTELAGAGFDSLKNTYLCYSVAYYDEKSRGFSSALLLKYDKAGTLLWKKEYFGALSDQFIPASAVVDNAGNLYVTGTTKKDVNYPLDTLFAETVKFNPAGEAVWVKIYDGSELQDEPHSLCLDQEKNVFITGYTTTALAGLDVVTVKYCGSCESPVLFTISQDTFCMGSSPLTLSGGIPAGGSYTGEGVVNGVFYPDSAGPGNHTITYSFTDSTGCTASFGQQVFVDVCTGEPAIHDLIFSVYPNPFADFTTIQFSLEKNESVKIELMDLQGRKIKSIAEGNFDAGIHKVILKKESAPGSVYLLQLQSGAGIQTQKLVIQ